MDKPTGSGARARGGGRGGAGNPPTGGSRGRRAKKNANNSGELGATSAASQAQSVSSNPNVGGARTAAAPSTRRNPENNGAPAPKGTPVQSAWDRPNVWGNPNAASSVAANSSDGRTAAAPAPSSWRNPDNRGVPSPAAAPNVSGAQVTAGPVQSAWGSNAAALPWRSTNNGGARGTAAPQPVAARQPAAAQQPASALQSAAARQHASVPQPAAAQQPAAPQHQAPVALRRENPVAEDQGAAGLEGNRGSVRGRRLMCEMVNSRPRDLVTKIGTTGDQVKVMANYFRILKSPNWSVHQYRVDFSPDIELLYLRRVFLGHHRELFGGYIFDGTVLFSSNFFTDKGQLELLTKNREGETIQIKIKHVGIVDATDVQQLQIQNLIIRRAMEGLRLQLVGRNYFDPLAKIAMNNYHMEIWPGYQTSIRQHERDILMCAEITHKVMRTENLYEILKKCCNMQDYQQTFRKKVVGTIVLTGYNNKTYRVDDVDYESSPMSTFPTKEGEISFAEYYKKRYNLQLRDSRQPMLVSRPTEKNIRGGQSEFIMLIPELCRATGITDEMRNNFRLMRAMGEHTRLNPDRRIERLRTFNNRLQSSKPSMDVLTQWNMQLDRNLVEIPGRILYSENILFGNKRTYKCDDNADWTREFRNNNMYITVNIARWSVIVPKRNVNEVEEFIKLCIKAAQGMSMRIDRPTIIQMLDDRNGSYSQAIDKASSQDLQLLFLVLVSNNEDKYSLIKKKCCVDKPIPSQVVTLRTITPKQDKSTAGLMSVATKVVIQMNAKLKGAPWMVHIPLSGLMTVGFDVCHSAKDKNKSYGALVATMDVAKSTRYFSAVTEHLKGQELSNDISLKMKCALTAYLNVHGKLPERILFYRDGVGDGQLHQVFNTEVQMLKKCLDETYIQAGIKTGCRLAFIVVSKRINTRYFYNYRNPLPGTVVDDNITLPERYDFFLVSQSVRQGTVSPTSYNVIHDNMGIAADKLQILTYKMTHLYYNWSGTLRVPAVCQYAHKLAFLVAESIHRAPHHGLENQLYFL